MSEARSRLAPPAAPVMPVRNVSNDDEAAAIFQHNDHICSKGFVSDHWYALVHTPVRIDKAKAHPEGRKALQKEWRISYEGAFSYEA